MRTSKLTSLTISTQQCGQKKIKALLKLLLQVNGTFVNFSEALVPDNINPSKVPVNPFDNCVSQLVSCRLTHWCELASDLRLKPPQTHAWLGDGISCLKCFSETQLVSPQGEQMRTCVFTPSICVLYLNSHSFSHWSQQTSARGRIGGWMLFNRCIYRGWGGLHLYCLYSVPMVPCNSHAVH